MQKSSVTTKVLYIFLMIWAISCITMFMYFPGRASYTQRTAVLNDPRLFLERVGQIDIQKYLLDLIYSFIGLSIFVLTSTLLGKYVASYWKFERPALTSKIDQLTLYATEFILGNALLSLIFLALAAWNKLTIYNILGVLALCVVLGLWEMRKTGWQIPNPFKGIPRTYFLTWLSMILLGLTLLQSTARISYDSSSIYFSDAKITAMSHGIRYFVGDIFEVSVFQSTIQYSVLIRLFGDQAARMFSWVCGMIFVIFAIALARKLEVSKRTIPIFLTLFATTTAFTDLMGDGKVDLIGSMSALAAIYWMVHTDQDGQQSTTQLVFIGFLVGIACMARPFNAFLLAVFLFIYYGQKVLFQKPFDKSNLNQFTQTFFWLILGILGPAVYYLLANWIILKSPVAFMSSILSIKPTSGPWDFAPGEISILRIFYPIVITFRNTPQSLGNISPLFLAFLPSLLIPDIRKGMQLSREMVYLVVTSLITLILWIVSFFTVTELRYILFLWAILFIPAAEIIARTFATPMTLFATLGKIIVTTLLLFSIARSIYISFISYSPIDQNGNPQCADAYFCDMLKSVNQTAALGDRDLNLSASRYYLRSDLFACSTTHAEYTILKEYSDKNPELFWEEVYRQGYKFITYEYDYTTRHLQFGLIPSPANTPNWITLEPLYGKPGDLYVSYRIHISNPPLQVKKVCYKNELGIWEIQNLK